MEENKSMGLSYCAGPASALEEPAKKDAPATAPTTRDNYRVRSPGCSPNGNAVEVRNFCDNGFLNEIREVLQNEKPPGYRGKPATAVAATPAQLFRTDSKRRKHILNLLFKSRRSSLPVTRILPKEVAVQRTKEGRKYFQIAIDYRNPYTGGNSSTYQVNQCKDPTTNPAVKKIMKDTMTAGKPTPSSVTMTPNPIFRSVDSDPVSQLEQDNPTCQLEDVNDYYLGISEEYPHLVLSDDKAKRSQGDKSETKHMFPTSPISVPRPVGPNVRDFADNTGTTFATRAIDFERQYGLGLKGKHVADPATNVQSLPVCSFNALDSIDTQAAPPRISLPVTYKIRKRSKAHPPRIPRQSAQQSSPEMKTVPLLDCQSRPPSLLSANGSTAEDVQSDAESGVVLEAQSAEFVRAQAAAGYYSGYRQPPMPGPAPTRALPSLPERYDSITHPLIEPAQGRSSIEPGPERSPTKIPPKSPARKYGRFSPNIIRNKDSAASPQQSTELQRRRKHSPSPTLGQTNGLGVFEPSDDSLPSAKSPATLEQWENERARSRKLLKARDLERLRAHQECVSPNKIMDEKFTNQEEGRDDTVILPAGEYPYRFKPFVDDHRQWGHHVSEPTTTGSEQMDYSKLENTLSPIVLVAEQKPAIATPLVLTGAQQACAETTMKENELPTKVRTNQAHAMDLPFVLEENPQQQNGLHGPPRLGVISHERNSRPASTAFDVTEHRISMSAADLEARLEARIAAVEKKSVLLEKAFLAVINASSTFSTQTTVSSADRSSGLSGTSSIHGPWESKVDAMIMAMHGNGRSSTSPGP